MTYIDKEDQRDQRIIRNSDIQWALKYVFKVVSDRPRGVTSQYAIRRRLAHYFYAVSEIDRTQPVPRNKKARADLLAKEIEKDIQKYHRILKGSSTAK